MSRQRTVILVPDPQEPADDYWHNFVWRVRDALRRDGLSVRVVAIEPAPRDGGDDAPR